MTVIFHVWLVAKRKGQLLPTKEGNPRKGIKKRREWKGRGYALSLSPLN